MFFPQLHGDRYWLHLTVNWRSLLSTYLLNLVSTKWQRAETFGSHSYLGGDSCWCLIILAANRSVHKWSVWFINRNSKTLVVAFMAKGDVILWCFCYLPMVFLNLDKSCFGDSAEVWVSMTLFQYRKYFNTLSTSILHKISFDNFEFNYSPTCAVNNHSCIEEHLSFLLWWSL